ncbi:MAG: tyrosine-protein kinase [Solirubrobacteraceae bacterium]|jgi:receptor protein-tyrosine kinase|nr:tyrosine-protein kinase [Solirubrobacteraceae bacterium]
MRSHADETLKAAVRRSLPILVGLIVIGVLASNAVEQLKGPSYSSTSRVEVSATPLSSIITNTQPSFVDPQRSLDTAMALAGSPQVYTLAARQLGGRLGSSSALQHATSVAEVPNTDILSFTATSAQPDHAVRIANAAGTAYIAFRGQLHANTISSTIDKLRTTLATLPPGPQHDQVAAELNRAELLQGATSTDATLVQQAVSANKISPAPAKDSLIGLALGLVIGLLVIALREAVDSTVRSEGDVEELLSAPVLATVRPLPRRTKMVTYGRYEARFSDTYSLLAAQLAPPKNAKEAKVLAVTSALSREGKTTTAANLAVTAARRGLNVVLADFDFRKSELSSLFGVPSSAPGALQVLNGEIDLGEVMWSVKLDGPQPAVHRNGRVPAIDPVTSDESFPEANGREAKGTLQLLSTGGELSPRRASERPVLAPLLRQLRAEAQMVVIDTPPALLTSEMTELAELIDLAIVVVRQGYVSRRSLRSLARHAASWPTEVAGAVLTDVRVAAGYGAYYGAK